MLEVSSIAVQLETVRRIDGITRQARSRLVRSEGSVGCIVSVFVFIDFMFLVLGQIPGLGLRLAIDPATKAKNLGQFVALKVMTIDEFSLCAQRQQQTQ
jgi:hypothetical protein